MAHYLKQHYGDCEGPLGLPCLDRQAQALEGVLRGLPRDRLHQPGHLLTLKGPAELAPGDRADVSWITTEDLDRQREVVRAAGMNDEHFALNPVVTLNHDYESPPVGRSLWRRRVREGGRVGIKARTHYPPRPADWPDGETWYPDHAFSLIQADLLRGKSIGFLPTKVRVPSDEERTRTPALKDVWRVVEEWVLLEYACVFLPAQQFAVVEAVSKGLGTLTTLEHHLRRRLETLDFAALAERACREALARARGEV